MKGFQEYLLCNCLQWYSIQIWSPIPNITDFLKVEEFINHYIVRILVSLVVFLDAWNLSIVHFWEGEYATIDSNFWIWKFVY